MSISQIGGAILGFTLFALAFMCFGAMLRRLADERRARQREESRREAERRRYARGGLVVPYDEPFHRT